VHKLLARVNLLLRKMENVEDFVAPHQADRWLAAVSEAEDEPVVQELVGLPGQRPALAEAVMLPIDQLVLTLAQDVFTSAADLALAHKLALVLRQAANEHPTGACRN
jgi:DNA helicase II / ATP-dependent DNA helicase PcrA